MSKELQLTIAKLEKAKDLKEMLLLPEVVDRFVKNYQKTTGKKDGLQRFEQEVFNFLSIAQDNPEIAKCERFSHYAAIIKAGTTGLSFRDGHLYPVVYKYDGGKRLILKTDIGAHGKREMLMRMPNIKFVGEAQIIFKGDTFKYDPVNRKVLDHTFSLDMKRVVEKTPHYNEQKRLTKVEILNVLGVYCPIDFIEDGKIRREDVLLTIDDIRGSIVKAKTLVIWFANTGEMIKKGSYNRAFKLYHRYPEGEITDYQAFDADDDFTAPVVPEEKKQPIQQKKNKDSSISDAEVVQDDENQEADGDDKMESFFE
jgi:recombinational DNA repair protein RecT